MNPLLIDSNERGALPDAMKRRAQQKRPTVPIEERRLVIGDYQCGEWPIEAKTVGDFFESQRSGHLMRQLDNMDANADFFGLLVWGSVPNYVKQVKGRGGTLSVPMALKQLSGGLARVVADFGCLVYRAPDLTEASHFLVSLHEKSFKPASRHGAQAIRRVSTNDVRVDMLLTIPGVGPELVERILEACGCVEEVACVDCLKQVRGLGPVIRKRIIEAFTSEEPVKYERTQSR
tara:strand:+ start:463 stop:1161 length:699 start_codon:yes stop_codon:yes gene_type:complete